MDGGRSTATHARVGGLVPKNVAYIAFRVGNKSIEDK